jgi:hypothetical protein
MMGFSKYRFDKVASKMATPFAMQVDLLAIQLSEPGYHLRGTPKDRSRIYNSVVSEWEDRSFRGLVNIKIPLLKTADKKLEEEGKFD